MSLLPVAVWTTNGRNLVAGPVQSTSNVCQMAYVGISTGCGLLSAPLVAGNSYTALSLVGTLPASLANNQSLIITDGTNSQAVTTSAAIGAGASTITVNTFTAAYNFAASTTGVAPQPQATDISLYNESVRVATFAGAAGGAAGESLTSGYMDGTQATNIYLMVGYFGGPTATSSTGTGTLMVEDVQFWNHVLEKDSNMYLADSTV